MSLIDHMSGEAIMDGSEDGPEPETCSVCGYWKTPLCACGPQKKGAQRNKVRRHMAWVYGQTICGYWSREDTLVDLVSDVDCDWCLASINRRG